jgi:hypothetical protein
MDNKRPHDGRAMGIIFTAFSLSMIPTGLGPVFFVMPAFAFKMLAQPLVDNGFFHANVDKLTTVLLALTFLIAIIIFLIVIKKTVVRTGQFSRARITTFLVIICLLVHAPGYYIYLWAEFNFRPYEDDISSYLLIESFPYTSFAFIPIGLLFDAVIYKYQDQRTKTDEI